MSQRGLIGLARHADPSPPQSLALADGRSSLGEPGTLFLPAAGSTFPIGIAFCVHDKYRIRRERGTAP